MKRHDYGVYRNVGFLKSMIMEYIGMLEYEDRTILKNRHYEDTKKPIGQS